jgi:hypothetical protein
MESALLSDGQALPTAVMIPLTPLYFPVPPRILPCIGFLWSRQIGFYFRVELVIIRVDAGAAIDFPKCADRYRATRYGHSPGHSCIAVVRPSAPRPAASHWRPASPSARPTRGALQRAHALLEAVCAAARPPLAERYFRP